jgi:hypothetical protein
MMAGYQPLSRAAADQHAVDRDALKKLIGQVIADAGGAVILPLALLGDRLGLFSALASGIPATAGQLAERTGLTKRLHRKEAVMARKMIDCRKVPNEIGCTLTIAGNDEAVLDAAVAHAVAKHGHPDTPELRELLRGGLEDAEPALA